jgi:predicted TIM-barrel fold metal-dependent hydrolase
MVNHEFRVLDFHSHFPVQRTGNPRGGYMQSMIEKFGERKAKIFMEQSAKYREDWRHKWGFDTPETSIHSDEEQAERWVADLDKKNVERVNFVMGGGNDNLAKIVKMYPDKFTGFAHHDLFSQNAADELERAVTKLGLRGFKLLSSGLTRNIDDKEAYPVWEMAEKLEIPVLIHFGVLGGGGGPARNLHNLDPLSLWEVAASYPTLKFVIPHFGACYFRELLQLCWACPNVMIDTSGSNQWMAWMPYKLTLRDLFLKCLETVGANRIIFGTDSSYFPRGFSENYLREQIREVRAIGVEDSTVDKIFYRNAARLLKLES